MSRSERKAAKQAQRLLVRQQRAARHETLAAHPVGNPRQPREWQVGRLRFFNRPPQQDVLIEDVPRTSELLHGALVSARTRLAPTGGTSEARAYGGGVYRSDGAIVEEFLEHERRRQALDRAVKICNPPTVESGRIAGARMVDGTCVYLGDLKPHFGHFLLESLARAWFLLECDRVPTVIFHGGPLGPTELGPFALSIFRVLGVDPSRIIVAREDLRVGELIVPRAQYLNAVMGSPGMCIVFDHLRERILKARPRDPTPEKVYFSRRNLPSLAIGGGPRRAFVNEEEVETLFRKLGFEVLSPESLPFEEQVAIVANASHVAGLAGAALHLILFNGKPGTKLIELRTKPALNQQIINSIRGVDAFHVWCLGQKQAGRVITLDIGAIDKAMSEIE